MQKWCDSNLVKTLADRVTLVKNIGDALVRTFVSFDYVRHIRKGSIFYSRRFLSLRFLIRAEAGFLAPTREFYDYLDEQTRNEINYGKERIRKQKRI